MLSIFVGVLVWVVAIAWVVAGVLYWGREETFSFRKFLGVNIIPALALVLLFGSIYIVEPGHAHELSVLTLDNPIECVLRRNPVYNYPVVSSDTRHRKPLGPSVLPSIPLKHG